MRDIFEGKTAQSGECLDKTIRKGSIKASSESKAGVAEIVGESAASKLECRAGYAGLSHCLKGSKTPRTERRVNEYCKTIAYCRMERVGAPYDVLGGMAGCRTALMCVISYTDAEWLWTFAEQKFGIGKKKNLKLWILLMVAEPDAVSSKDAHFPNSEVMF